MELRHFRYFVTVAEEENITRAAEILRISQPSLSRQIRDLEGELGLVLFQRGPRSLRLTGVGRVFLAEARAVLHRVEEAVMAVRAVAEGEGGEIHVGFAPSLTVEILPQALRRFGSTNPGVRVRLHDLSTQEMVDQLHEKEIHAALTIRPSARKLKGLVFEELRRFGVCIATHQDHPLAREEHVGLADLVNERLIAYDGRQYPEYRTWLTRLFSHENSEPRIAEEHESSTGLIAAVEAGRGIALIQDSFGYFSGPRLTIKALHPAPPPFVAGIAYRDDLEASAVKAFVAAVKGG